MTHSPELEQAVAERLHDVYWKRVEPSETGRCVGWLAVAREHLKMRDEAMMEAARKVRDAVLLAALALKILGPAAREQLSQPGFDDDALRKIIGLEGEEEG